MIVDQDMKIRIKYTVPGGPGGVQQKDVDMPYPPTDGTLIFGLDSYGNTFEVMGEPKLEVAEAEAGGHEARYIVQTKHVLG